MIRASAFLIACCLSTAAAAITLEPIGAPQSARSGTFFRNPMGVTVRDDSGKPVSGAKVQFLSQRGNLQPAGREVFTNAKGIALLTQVIATGGPEPAAVHARYGGIEVPLAPLLIVRDGPSKLEIVSGDNQEAQLGRPFAAPWKVRALDASGRAVPYAAVYFNGNAYAEWPSAVFAPDDFVMADARGIATSPIPRAYGVTGRSFASDACLVFSNGCVDFHYRVVDPSSAYSLELVSAPPLSLEMLKAPDAPLVVRARNAAGVPISGVPIRFEHRSWNSMGWDGGCATFPGGEGDAEEATVLTDSSGLAVSPPYVAKGFGAWSCFVVVSSGDYEDPLYYSFLVFRPEQVVIDMPESVNVSAGRRFSIEASFLYFDHPIYGLPAEVTVVPGTPGASAALVNRKLAAPYDAGDVTMDFIANSKIGTYQIVLTRGPVSRTIVVNQR